MGTKKGSVLPQAILQKYFELRDRRLRLEAEARALEKGEYTLKADIMDSLRLGHVHEKGAFHAQIVPGKKSVSWKNEFIKYNGQELADKIFLNAPTSETLEVTMNVI